ncbi:MAG: alpha/beta hydrolase family protein, partial [Pirellulaceae bacterium]|nr:alpha/beta hydrolase family protein [Pirellulaceae bacterium]
MMRTFICLTLLYFTAFSPTAAQEPTLNTSRGDAMIAKYFAQQTSAIEDRWLAGIKTKEDWLSQREKHLTQLKDMLGLNPFPQKTPLNAVITGTTKHESFRVEKIHFQSRPGLYVTGNLYVPHEIDNKLPAILYVCGHGQVKINGVSYGAKAHYQHHGAWFARNGYVCLTIDTLQLGEIEGIHHGTYR